MSIGGFRTEAEPERPRRRESPLLARSPVFALVMSALCVWLGFGLWPDAVYFFSSRDPIDLGAPGAYHLDAAVANRLVHVRGRLVDPMTATERPSGAQRTVGRLAGTNLLVDRPGPPGSIDLFEGRLLPLDKRDKYADAAGILRERGTPLGEGWQVLRDGERPRRGWLPVLGLALLLLVLAVNVRALVRPILAGFREPR